MLRDIQARIACAHIMAKKIRKNDKKTILSCQLFSRGVLVVRGKIRCSLRPNPRLPPNHQKLVSYTQMGGKKNHSDNSSFATLFEHVGGLEEYDF